MTSPTRITWLRAPLLALAILLFALLLLLPIAAIQAQTVSASAPAAVVTVDGEVSDMVVKGKSLEVRYRNTGTTATEIVGEVQVRLGDDSLVVAVPLVEGKRIDAGKRETFRVAMPSLPPGKYTIYAVVNFGGDSLTAAQAELEIRP
ncbi:hypothetical protein [Gemmatimonas groenlandica]|uniref:CARDB domain-containing protein n=1 Tax=Gemmatimonas groenlandica TaxID=2732249 RepID=A0A6M4IK15_9BACT|nr:hypothetical protein [Gemmatimonas groenlandica]QJR34405.1 hypothetical protein HKW67_02145 [Gemmatimonas groenlandica]